MASKAPKIRNLGSPTPRHSPGHKNYYSSLRPQLEGFFSKKPARHSTGRAGRLLLGAPCPLSLGRDDTRSRRVCPLRPLPGPGAPRVQDRSRSAQLWRPRAGPARHWAQAPQTGRLYLYEDRRPPGAPRASFPALPDAPHLRPTGTSGSGVGRKWAGGGGCARRRWRRCRAAASRPRAGAGSERSGVEVFRSEERRVGKECRSRWSPYH